MSEPEEDADLFEIVVDAAHMGDACPSTAELARLLGITLTAAQLGLDRLRRKGLIDWHVAWCGERRGKLRVVTILATGERTREPLPPELRPCSEDPELEQAKSRLRRKGHIVFDAWITDGMRGRDLVRVDHRRLTRQAVLDLAGVVVAGVVS